MPAVACTEHGQAWRSIAIEMWGRRDAIRDLYVTCRAEQKARAWNERLLLQRQSRLWGHHPPPLHQLYLCPRFPHRLSHAAMLKRYAIFQEDPLPLLLNSLLL